MFFWLLVPERHTSALLLTERRARFGIKTGFWGDFFIGQLRQKYPHVTFALTYYVPRQVWDEYRERGQGLEGALLRRVIEETDETKELDNPSRRHLIGTMTTSIDRKTAPMRDRIADMLHRGDAREAIEILVGGNLVDSLVGDIEEYDTVKLRLNLDGKLRTVTIGQDRVPQLGYPVDAVQNDEEGYPQVADLAEFAAQLAREIGGPLGLS